MSEAWPPRASVAIPVSAVVVAAGWTSLGGAATVTAGAGTLALAALAWAALRTPRAEVALAGQVVPLAIGLLLLAVSGAGLDVGPGALSWRPLVAITAFPFLGKALVRLVAAHCMAREADVVVEAALVGTAAGIVLHATANGWRPAFAGSPWSDASGAFPAALVAVDVALFVVLARSLRSPAARRGPLGFLGVGVTLLLGAHLLQAVALSRGELVDAVAVGMATLGLLAIGAAALHPAATREPDRMVEPPALFSPAHAGLIVAALLAVPAVLTVQAASGSSASTTVATGAVVSGVLLAGYLVGLLRERAITEHRATHDALTDLPNRTLLVDRLDRSIAHARRNGSSCAVLFMDLDSFKEVNDSFGHAAGDGLLGTVADRLSQCVREEDTVARLSGDEFVILLPFLTSPEHVVTVARRVLDSIGHPVTVAEQRMLLAGSIGIAVYPADGDTADELLASADAAMYRAKETVGSSWELFSARLATQAQARLQVESGLLDGLARDELVLHYQPIVDVPSGHVIGAEALVRWNHPERGFLLPGHFVPIAEQSDLIVMLGEKVVFDACQQLREWQELGIRDRFISVNVSARQFAQGLVSAVTAALRATGADPHNLVVELTESTVVDNIGEVAAALQELASMGVRSAIDDFGTGYCGLRYLGSLPVAALKIDRSFIQGMTPSAAAIVAATIAMGHSLGLTLIAEGVETEDQLRFLTDQGCDRVQGYLLGRPMPASDMVDLLRRSTGLDPRPSALASGVSGSCPGHD